MGTFDDLIPSQSNPFDDLVPAATPQAKKNPMLGGAGAFASGVNRMVATGLPGLPVDTGINLVDLLKAGAGTLYKQTTDKSPPEFLDPMNRAGIPMSSAWLERQFAKVPGGEQIIKSDAAEYPGLHAAGMAAGSTVGSKTPFRTGSIASTAGFVGQKVGEASESQEAAILASLLTAPTLAQAGNIGRLNPVKLFDPAARQAAVALRPYSNEQIQRGIDLQRAAQAERNPISAAQALGGGGRVVDLENYVLDSQYAPPHLVQQAQSQPARAAAHATRITGQFGKSNFSLDRANKIEAAAEAGMAMPKEVARKLAQPFYDELARTRPQLPEAARWKLAGELETLNSKVGLLEDSFAGKAVSDVAKTATQDSVILSPTKGKVPFRRAQGGVYELDNYLKELSSRIQNLGTLGADAKQSVERAGLRPALGAIKEELLAASPTLAKAKDVYSTTRTALEDTVRSTGIADMAKRPDADMIKKPAANWNTLSNVLKRQQDPADLQRANEILARSDPDAVAQLTRNTLEQIRTKHFSDAHTLPATAYQFAKEVRALPNLNKAIEITAARAGALAPAEAARGFDVALRVLEASGSPRGLPSGGSTAAKIAASSPERSVTAIGAGHELAKRSAILRNIQQVINRREIQQLTKALDNPESLKALQELAVLEPTSARAKQIVREMVSPPTDMQNIVLRGLLPLASEPSRRNLLGE